MRLGVVREPLADWLWVVREPLLGMTEMVRGTER